MSDRLREADPSQFKLAEVIMGHDIVDGRGYDYGDGFSLERKKELMKKASVLNS